MSGFMLPDGSISPVPNEAMWEESRKLQERQIERLQAQIFLAALPYRLRLMATTSLTQI